MDLQMKNSKMQSRCAQQVAEGATKINIEVPPIKIMNNYVNKVISDIGLISSKKSLYIPLIQATLNQQLNQKYFWIIVSINKFLQVSSIYHIFLLARRVRADTRGLK